MNIPNVEWFVKDYDDSYVAHTEYYAGSCSSKEDLIVEVEIWNNRWNTKEDVANMKNAKLVISFADGANASLLSLCEVKINDNEFEKPDVSEFNRGLFQLGTISGAKNNGSEVNTDNYKKVILKFSNMPESFSAGMKSFMLDVQYDEV